MIAPRDLKPAAKDNQAENGDFSTLQESSQYVASFQQWYNILNQHNVNRSTPEANDADLVVKDPLLTVLHNTPKDCNSLSPVIGQANDKAMATSPWSTFGSSHSPANSKFKSWQETSVLETKIEKSKSISDSSVNHTLDSKPSDIPMTARKRSSSQILALLSKTVDKSQSRDIHSHERRVQVLPAPSNPVHHSEGSRGNSDMFTGEVYSDIYCRSLQNERLSSQLSMVQTLQSDLYNEVNKEQLNSSTTYPHISSHNTESFQADSKNQPDDSHYDLISTPMQKKFHDTQSDSEDNVPLECEPTHNGNFQPVQSEMNKLEHSELSKSQYSPINQCQLNGKNQNVEMNSIERKKPEYRGAEVEKYSFPCNMHDKPEPRHNTDGTSQMEFDCGVLSQKESPTVKSMEEEEEEEEACLGGASFAISFSPLSVIPSDSDSDLEGPQGRGDVDQGLEGGEGIDSSIHTTSAADILSSGKQIEDDVIKDSLQLSNHSQGEVSNKNDQSSMKNKSVSPVEFQIDKKTEFNLETPFKDNQICNVHFVDECWEEEESSMGESVHEFESGEVSKTNKIKKNGAKKEQKDLGDFSQKSLGCLELSPDSIKNFTDSSPLTSINICKETYHNEINPPPGVNPGRQKLPVFETSWSDESSLFDTSAERQGKHPLTVDKPDSQGSVLPKSLGELQDTPQRGRESSSVGYRKLGLSCDELFTLKLDPDPEGFTGETPVTDYAHKSNIRAPRTGDFPTEYTPLPQRISYSRDSEEASPERQCVGCKCRAIFIMIFC